MTASSAAGAIPHEELRPARQQQREQRHGEAEVGLDAEQAPGEHAGQMPVRLRVEQRRRHPRASDQRLPAHSTSSTRKRLRTRGSRSHVADGDDLVAARAARSGHVDHVALGLADQRARDGRGDRQQPVLDVRLVVADQLVDDLGAAVLVLELDRRSRTPRGRWPRSLVTSITSAFDSRCSISLMRPSMKLCCSRAAWYSAFSRQVAVGARLGDRLDDVRPRLALQLLAAPARSRSAPRRVMGVRFTPAIPCANPAAG